MHSTPRIIEVGHIDEIELLWEDKEFDYTKDFNFIGIEDPEIIQKYDAHSELYLIYRNRVEDKIGIKLSHPEIVRSRLNLIDFEFLKICWFKDDTSFRSIKQAYEYPWWTERSYKKNKFRIYNSKKKIYCISKLYYQLINYFLTKINVSKQRYWFSNYPF